MSKKKEFNLKDLVLGRISIGNVSIENEEGLQDLDGRNPTYNVKYIASYGLNLENERLRASLTLTIDVDIDKGQSNVSGKFDINFDFHVNKLKEWVEEVDGDFTIDKDLIVKLTSVAYSTSRGIIFTRCQGTVLSKAILPILPNSEIESMFQKRN